MVKFIKEVMIATWKTVLIFIKDMYRNIFGVSIMIFATCGLTHLLSMLPIELLFISVPFISEAMVVPIMAIFIIYIFSTIGPAWSLSYRWFPCSIK